MRRIPPSRSEKLLPGAMDTRINAQNGAKSLERTFFQFTKRIQYQTETKYTQQAIMGNAA